MDYFSVSLYKMLRYSTIIDYERFNNCIHSKMADVKLLVSRAVPGVYRCFRWVYFTFNWIVSHTYEHAQIQVPTCMQILYEM